GNILMASVKQAKTKLNSLPKSPTGIPGLDEITGGGLPQGRPTLVAGAAGCGKTLFAMEFLVNGAVEYGEPGVFVAFEENAEELAQNVASLGFDLKKLIRQKKLIVDYVRIASSEIEEAGEYDLEGLFIRLGHAIDSIGAKRVVLDTIEVLFSSFPNEGILRAELHRLFRWLKDKGVSAIVTGERGEGSVTRFGLEEYVADCVILLDQRVSGQIATRRLRILKYRGSLHGTNEYPFLIGRNGISVLPITSLNLEHEASRERLSTGIPELDEMLGNKGFYRGSSVLLSGTAGSGKTSLAASIVNAACQRGERCLYFAFEESPSQILRNMSSIGLDLAPHVKEGLLRFHATRPSVYGLEMHLVTMHDLIREQRPDVVVLDPITDFAVVGSEAEVKSAITRMIDFFKLNGITALFTSIVSEKEAVDESIVGVSSLIDAWISLRNIENDGERHRGLFILKSRGMPHSSQIRSLRLTDDGIKIGAMDMAGRRSVTEPT
ncbi:MAG TPA: circadian clock protein KaiC, partial [Anaerolineales bacterium]|nr:circadian clock protein KaiC [Anaerolineales bacterium]